MSNRERWIIYPFLFYALVMGFKATYRDPIEFKCRTIECEHLKVRSINGSTAIALPAMMPSGGVIAVPRDDESRPETAPPTDKPGHSDPSDEAEAEESDMEARGTDDTDSAEVDLPGNIPHDADADDDLSDVHTCQFRTGRSSGFMVAEVGM